MAYETKELTGALFVNENKETERQPDYTGNVKIAGKVWRLAAWKTVSRGDVEYLSIKITDPADYQRDRPQQGQTSQPKRHMSDEEFERRREEMRTRGQAVAPRPSAADDYADDDIPF